MSNTSAILLHQHKERGCEIYSIYSRVHNSNKRFISNLNNSNVFFVLNYLQNIKDYISLCQYVIETFEKVQKHFHIWNHFF